MVLSLVLLLAAASLAAGFLLRRKPLALACGAGAALLLLAAGCGPLPAWMLGDLQAVCPDSAPAAWGGRNAIVLLGGGTQREAAGQIAPLPQAYARILQTAALYQSCRASGGVCALLVSGGDALGTGRSEAEVYADLLRRVGVPGDDLVLEPQSLNTFRNAQLSQVWLRRWRADRVLLVTSGWHMRRALLYFAHFGPQPLSACSNRLQPRLQVWPSAFNLEATDAALHEHIGILRYRVYQALGWNPARVGAGAA